MSNQIVFTTNSTQGSQKQTRLRCIGFWELLQQATYIHFVDDQGGIMDGYAQRAERIAALYAKIYLESDPKRLFSNSQKRGRYYWMGLAAFAVKTVKDLFIDLRTFVSPSSREILAKGNFWLCMDIMPWHLAYSYAPESYDKCVGTRDTGTFQQREVVESMGNLPFPDAVHRINYLKANDKIRTAFALVKKIERTTDSAEKRTNQLQHLLLIAEHEQGNILQPLCWDEPDLRAATAKQRALSRISPVTELTFTHKRGTAYIKDPKFREEITSTAPEGTHVEDYPSRIKWIKETAYQYHGLMAKYSDYMHQEIQAIANWY